MDSRLSTSARRARLALLALLALALLAACDRNLAPFDPDEEPREPDLSKIFPAGADQAAAPVLPPAPPGRGSGAGPADASVADTPAAAPIEGTLQLAPALAGKVPGNSVLFIIARRGGAGPPLAVKRVFDPSFPLEFTLGPEDRMIQAMPFSGPLTLSARVDTDGNATTRTPGDLAGALARPVEPGATGVVILLDEVL